AAFAPGRPLVMWNVRDTRPDLHTRRFGAGAIARLAALASNRPACIVNNSIESARVHTVELGYDPDGWTIIPNGFDATRFRPSPADRAAVRAELGLDDA